jgi:hypothetical protein
MIDAGDPDDADVAEQVPADDVGAHAVAVGELDVDGARPGTRRGTPRRS